MDEEVDGLAALSLRQAVPEREVGLVCMRRKQPHPPSPAPRLERLEIDTFALDAVVHTQQCVINSLHRELSRSRNLCGSSQRKERKQDNWLRQTSWGATKDLL